MGKFLPVVISIVFFMQGLKAEIGKVDPHEWGAQFSVEEVKKSIFCLKKAGRRCATAFLIHDGGYVLTAYHLIAQEIENGAVLINKEGKALEQKLYDFSGNEYSVRVYSHLSQKDSFRQIFKGEQFFELSKKGKEIYQRMQKKGHFDEDSYINMSEYVDPHFYGQVDAIVLKIASQDLPQLKKSKISPLKLSLKSPLQGLDKRVFSAGFPWEQRSFKFTETYKRELKEQHPGLSSIENTDGRFSFLTGLISKKIGNVLISKATVNQIEGSDLNTSAVDGYSGSSGSPILNKNGEVIGVFSSSDGGMDPIYNGPHRRGPSINGKTQNAYFTSMEEAYRVLKMSEIFKK